MAQVLASDRERRADFMGRLSGAEAEQLLYSWKFWGREEQIEPAGPWSKWFYVGGRGTGKTRTAGEWLREKAFKYPGCRIALVAQTAADARDTMVEGESGILAISPPGFTPEYQPSNRALVWPNGSQGHLYSAEKPRILRGPSHHFAWGDEIATWAFHGYAWEMLLLTMRLPHPRPGWPRYEPRVIATTTPKPVKVLRDHIRTVGGKLVPVEGDKGKGVVVTHGTTYDNLANLAPEFIDTIIASYEGTRAGREELLAMLLEESEGSLWNREMIERNRVKPADVPRIKKTATGVDPPGGATECGIVTSALCEDDCVYVLADVSLQAKPGEWGRIAVAQSQLQGSRLVGEQNYGGDMVEHTIRTVPGGGDVRYRSVHAARGKQARAEPVSALSEQNRLKFAGFFPELEDELCNWEPDTGQPSPNRLDALVWSVYDLNPSRSRIRLDAIPGMPKGEAA
ncbi:MAG: terminase family protein [Acidimicrobiia bacterium]